ncbi:lipocalin-like domain-containing protein [Streptomyces sp. NPDC059785]|uniref:lipocalin-like domain-containing protein n=1 Tax=unclassified Streptomyces TaxID=2593676 RepID=UPI0036653BA4
MDEGETLHQGAAAPSRRTFLRGTATAGMLVALPGAALTACGGGDEKEGASPAPATTTSPTQSELTANGYGHTDADFARVGLRRDSIQTWEDGYRTAAHNENPDVFEWWYSDFTGEDGTVVSFTLSTRLDDGFVPAPGQAGRKPRSSVTVTDPDGTGHGGAREFAWDDFSSSKDRCDVRLGPFTLSGDLKTYRMKGQSGDVGVDLTLTSQVRPFRPGTGIVFLGDTQHYFGWLCAVPSGTATGTITVNGKKRSFTGRGYHDHNWGNKPFPYGVAHWRWGRGNVGRYATIGADLHLRKEFGSATVPVFLVDDTKSGKRMVGAYSTKTVTATESDPERYPESAYPKEYYSRVRWTYRNGGDRAAFTFTDTDQLIVSRQYVTEPTRTQQKAMADLGIDEIWYTRYATKNTLRLNLAGTRTSGNGTGTLEAAQFGLGAAPSGSTASSRPSPTTPSPTTSPTRSLQ